MIIQTNQVVNYDSRKGWQVKIRGQTFLKLFIYLKLKNILKLFI